MKDYLLGAVYIIEPDYTDEDIRTDLQNMKDCNFNLITLWPIANGWLAKSSTEWVFTQTIRVLDICQELGIKAIMQLFGQNQAYEFIPDSMLTEDMLIYDENGPSRNANNIWANLNHPVVRECIENHFKACIEALKDHPAVYGWDVYNEAHFRSDDAYTVRKYQQWLKEKYTDIQELNRQWHRRYETFSQINPKYRRSAYSVWSNQLPEIEYEKFRSENLTEICAFLYQTAKRYDDIHPIIIDGTSSNILSNDMTGRNNDEFDTALIPDIYGATFYPKSWGRNYKDEPWKLAMYINIPAAAARKAMKPYMVTELQTHTQSALTPGSEVFTYELYHWMMMCIFTGAQGLQLWRWRPFLHGYQATGRGLTDMSGRPNERSRAAKKVMDVILNNKDLFTDFQIEKPVVKIAYSYRSRLQFDAFIKWQNSFWPDCLDGWHKIFWDKGLTTDFTDLEKLDEEDFNTPVMVLPSIVGISDEIAEKLADYVKQGGILIADARLGTANYEGVVPKSGIPGPILSELFGIIEEDVGSKDAFIMNGKKVDTGFMYQTLRTTGNAKAVFEMENATPAVVTNVYGKGKTIYFNCLIGYEMSKNYNSLIRDYIIEEIVSRCGDRLLAEKDDKVHTAIIETPSKKAMLAVNFSNEHQELVIREYFKGKGLHNIITQEVLLGEDITKLALEPHEAGIYVWDK